MKKRQYQQPTTEVEDVMVDDMMVAAQYAAAVVAPPQLDPIDTDEISLASSSSMSSDPVENVSLRVDLTAQETQAKPESDTAPGNNGGRGNTADDDDDDSSAADSELDMAKELGQMISSGEEQVSSSQHNTRLSANEVDAYHTSLNELQDKLRFQVTLADTDLQADGGPWEAAGTLQHHMVEERTVVVISRLGGAMLEEGSALSLRKQDFSSLQHVEAVPPYILLGSILEVFGPVSRPLYSVRFEESRICAKAPSNETTTARGDDGNESKVEQKTVVDPWSRGGLYTKALQQQSSSGGDIQVYYLANSQTKATRFIDTHAIYQNSARGCDASNVYDEEVVHPSEMDFSDDEKERVAKGGNRKGRGRKQQQRRLPVANVPGGQSYVPTGFHGAASSETSGGPAYQQSSSSSLSPAPTTGASFSGQHYSPAVPPSPPQQRTPRYYQSNQQPLPPAAAPAVANPDDDDDGSDTEYYAFD